jgi:hypothetical protein
MGRSSQSSRKRVWFAVLLAGCALLVERSLSLDAPPADVTSPSVNRSGLPAAVSPRVQTDRGARDHVRLEKLEARQRELDATAEPADSARALFGRISWAPPAPPPAPAPPPPPPVVPPFPYSYLGSIVDEGVRTVFVGKGERVLNLKTGDAVDGAYRVDSMNDRQMTMTYLPLGQVLTLPIGAPR